MLLLHFFHKQLGSVLLLAENFRLGVNQPPPRADRYSVPFQGPQAQQTKPPATLGLEVRGLPGLPVHAKESDSSAPPRGQVRHTLREIGQPLKLMAENHGGGLQVRN